MKLNSNLDTTTHKQKRKLFLHHQDLNHGPQCATNEPCHAGGNLVFGQADWQKVISKWKLPFQSNIMLFYFVFPVLLICCSSRSPMIMFWFDWLFLGGVYCWFIGTRGPANIGKYLDQQSLPGNYLTFAYYWSSSYSQVMI